MSWTDERVELLRKLWTEGLSASQIAAELANGITRNAVIGKVHRLGLSGRVKSAQAPSAPRPRAPAAPRAPQTHSQRVTPTRTVSSAPMMTRGATALALETEAYAAPIERPAEDVVIPMSERVTIMDLREAMCRWPLGDPSTPEFRYCGGRSDIGAPYCSHHSRLAYQPAQDRRRERERRVAQRI